ncbi:glucose-6-phosphate isomerase [Natronospira proteinivora]|uniref:Glucose-6-phosphate isomerase n=1 Tax=Natronospira proteinivora TaxID=1807133 RepID=A0ABT1G8B5_9GAMM|nr:glucose-6-phosphate isomerase [Natronospira proteinivora]MCP1726202.1 glucose-6-phosphate isomerase [Natronospira proteinivora]
MQEKWDALRRHWEGARLSELFARDPDRAKRHCVEVAGLRIDWSRQFLDSTTQQQLLALAGECGFGAQRQALFQGEVVNASEGRAALHMALRGPANRDWRVAGSSVSLAVEAELAHMEAFVAAVHAGQVKGATGAPIRDVVNIGIGGSHLGPEMLATALPAAKKAPRLHFLSNVDPAQSERILGSLDPAETLFIVVSKSFTSRETMINAGEARGWIARALGETAVVDHFAAVSTNEDKVRAFGICAERQFRFWDWVGGRYSLWSSAGLAAAVHLGMPRFHELLDGAAAMDRHFESAPDAENAPLMMGLLDLQSIMAFGWPAWAVVPYADSLRLLPDYFQQLVMESNGKGVTQTGGALIRQSGPLLLGGIGTDAQHAFFQLLHQGPLPVPVDFIAAARSGSQNESATRRHQVLLANCLAQAQALAEGRSEAAVRQAMEQAGLDAATIKSLAPQKRFPGNRPSNLLLMRELCPQSLGALIALYEHRVFVQACLLGINPFDQMGVELGKQLAREMEKRLGAEGREGSGDSAVAETITWLQQQWREQTS